MSEIERNPADLTEEQKKIVQDVYGYIDTAAYSDEEIAIAKQMFDTPEKFRLLRKILQVFTHEERGLSMPDPLNSLSAENFEKLGIEVSIARKVDERIRSTLVNFYLTLREEFREDKRIELEKQNQAEFEENKRTEKYKEEQEETNRVLGPNL